MTDIDNELPPAPGDPIPTTTILLDLINWECEQMLLAGCDAAEAAAQDEGNEPDAYYTKVRDVLRDRVPGRGDKITLPDTLLTPEVMEEIQGEIIWREERAAHYEYDLHPDVEASKKRLDL